MLADESETTDHEHDTPWQQPGEIELRLGRSCADTVHCPTVTLTGHVRHADHTRRLTAEADVTAGVPHSEAS